MQAIIAQQPKAQEPKVLSFDEKRNLNVIQRTIAVVAMLFSVVSFAITPGFITFSIAAASTLIVGINCYQFYQSLRR